MGEAISISDKHLQCTVDLTAQTPPLFSSATLGTDAGLRPEQTCDDCCVSLAGAVLEALL